MDAKLNEACRQIEILVCAGFYSLALQTLQYNVKFFPGLGPSRAMFIKLAIERMQVNRRQLG